mmetsp:Transcript_30133/g.36966  ORF Transcript_30133/g.36966 Transcript_30133/m.36966 type:complete len:103 (+) Transcript_30133:53-361(+)
MTKIADPFCFNNNGDNELISYLGVVFVTLIMCIVVVVQSWISMIVYKGWIKDRIFNEHVSISESMIIESEHSLEHNIGKQTPLPSQSDISQNEALPLKNNQQ